eukprot:CAMPEP_0113605456 /NCGR_PEP_ID=MMETSP0017_2-20120614/2338_1 /TAXON_ID=2856 /ORGANISM="Cylindrotheca closterium" /LENGTH=190 /DNA_ID=CAMNT_0000513949 /DNA_START=133 /DNA_END=702 /DNA_ORIENTATION=- /assembly_acc=CAM_ASM_000147
MTSSRQPFSSPSLLAVIGTAALVLSSSNSTANAQGQPYDYTSEHVVARASAISKDFQSIGGFLAQQNGADRQNARALYQLGAYCQSFATLQLNTVLTEAIIQGATVTGTSESGATISGILHSDAFPGDATIEVMYLIPSDGITKICSVSGNPTPQYDQCFVTTGEITLPDGSTLGYTGYDLDNDTANGLS